MLSNLSFGIDGLHATVCAKLIAYAPCMADAMTRDVVCARRLVSLLAKQRAKYAHMLASGNAEADTRPTVRTHVA